VERLWNQQNETHRNSAKDPTARNPGNTPIGFRWVSLGPRNTSMARHADHNEHERDHPPRDERYLDVGRRSMLSVGCNLLRASRLLARMPNEAFDFVLHGLSPSRGLDGELQRRRSSSAFRTGHCDDERVAPDGELLLAFREAALETHLVRARRY
jgi:hypothetical protein